LRRLRRLIERIYNHPVSKGRLRKRGERRRKRMDHV